MSEAISTQQGSKVIEMLHNSENNNSNNSNNNDVLQSNKSIEYTWNVIESSNDSNPKGLQNVKDIFNVTRKDVGIESEIFTENTIQSKFVLKWYPNGNEGCQNEITKQTLNNTNITQQSQISQLFLCCVSFPCHFTEIIANIMVECPELQFKKTHNNVNIIENSKNNQNICNHTNHINLIQGIQFDKIIQNNNENNENNENNNANNSNNNHDLSFHVVICITHIMSDQSQLNSINFQNVTQTQIAAFSYILCLFLSMFFFVLKTTHLKFRVTQEKKNERQNRCYLGAKNRHTQKVYFHKSDKQPFFFCAHLRNYCCK